MVLMHPYRYENVSVLMNELEPTVHVQEWAESVPADGVLIRNLFSLMGTQADETLLRFLPDTLKLPQHPGYVSVGKIVTVGAACSRFVPGDVVILPVQYSRYIMLAGEQMRGLSQSLLQKLPPSVDPVRALFLPLICLSLDIFEQLSEIGGERIVLLGGGLLSAVLLKILYLKNVRSVICIPGHDRYKGWLENGALEVWTGEQSIPPHLHRYANAICLLSHSEWCKQAIRLLLTEEGRCISALREGSEQGGYAKRPSWLCRDAIGDALDTLDAGELVLTDMIEQHIHAEAMAETYRSICAGCYRGKAIVYDW